METLFLLILNKGDTMKKKGMELSLNTIIIAAICIVVLFVIIGVFTNWFGKTSDDIHGLTDCPAMGDGTGQCYALGDSRDNLNCVPAFGGCGADEFCCWKN